jgi:CheY-like chemotaxis protein
MEILAEKAHSKGLELASIVDPDVPQLFRGDPGRLRQIILNLAGNALKFTETGEVTLWVMPVYEWGARWLRFEVRDTGPGIAAAVQARIFEDFYQVDGSNQRRHDGTGLGLAIVKHLVEMMGGRVGVISKSGRGSLFWFNLPLRPTLEHKAAPLNHQAAFADLRVLVVAASESTWLSLQHQLTAWGIPNRAAGSGREALEELRSAGSRKEPYNLVIGDTNLRDLEGLQLAHLIQGDQGIPPVKVILLTSWTAGDLEAQGGRGAVQAYLSKPVGQSQLYNCLTSLLATKPPGPKPNQPASAAQLSGRVLVAEDNQVNQLVAQSMLEALGCQVEVVANGAQVLEALVQQTYDLIFMDCQMPEIDGYGATKMIREQEGQAGQSVDPTASAGSGQNSGPAAGPDKPRHIPIVAMTASVMEGEYERCLATGMDDYVSKPFKLEDLQRVLERWLPQGGETLS